MGSDSVKVQEKQASHYSVQKVLNQPWVCLETYIGSYTPFATSDFSCLWALKSIANTKTQNSKAAQFIEPLLEFMHLSLMLKFNVKYFQQLLQCLWCMYKPLGWEVSQAETINSATHLWWKAWPAIYSEFRIPLQLSAFCLTNVTVWHEIAPKSSFMVLLGTTYEETRGGHKRMKHSASEKNSGHVCALSGKPL